MLKNKSNQKTASINDGAQKLLAGQERPRLIRCT